MNLKHKFIHHQTSPYTIHFQDSHATRRLTRRIHQMISHVQKERPIVIVCIGSDRSTGDALGPLIGSYLKKKQSLSYYVYGSLDAPIHAVNLSQKLCTLEHRHENPFVIGVDAGLGKSESIGTISVDKGPVRPGAGVKKQLPAVGNMHLTGIVNVSGFMEYSVLQNTRLYLVSQMADAMALSLHTSCDRRFNTLENGKSKRFPYLLQR